MDDFNNEKEYKMMKNRKKILLIAIIVILALTVYSFIPFISLDNISFNRDLGKTDTGNSIFMFLIACVFIWVIFYIMYFSMVFVIMEMVMGIVNLLDKGFREYDWSVKKEKLDSEQFDYVFETTKYLAAIPVSILIVLMIFNMIPL